jgi:phage terminase large subunit-like protein
VFDPWQEYVAWKAFRHGADRRFRHRTTLWSTARQNGKSVIVRAFYGWLLDEGRKLEPFCHWSDIRAAAHDAKQARIIYRAVYQDLAAVPELTRPPHREHGETMIRPPIRLSRQIGIETDSLFFDTLTSEPGSARGLSLGALAFDELLTQRDHGMMEAVRPTQMVQISPITLLTSTAGFADSVVLREYYDRLRRQAAGDEAPDPSFYGAWWESEDPEAGLDWPQIRQANPSPRIDREAITSEYRDLPVDDPLLDAQIPNAARRMVGMDGAFCFSRAQSLGPIDAIIAMTFAAHSIASGAPVPNIF